MKMKKLLLSLGTVAAVAAPVATVVACSSDEVTTIYNQFSITGLSFQEGKNPASGTDSKLFVVNALGNNSLVKDGTVYKLVPTAKLTDADKVVSSTKGLMLLVDETGKKTLAAGKTTELVNKYITKGEFKTEMIKLIIPFAKDVSDDASTDTILNYSKADLVAVAKAYQAMLVEKANAGTSVATPIIAVDFDLTTGTIAPAKGLELMQRTRDIAIDAIFDANSGR